VDDRLSVIQIYKTGKLTLKHVETWFSPQGSFLFPKLMNHVYSIFNKLSFLINNSHNDQVSLI